MKITKIKKELCFEVKFFDNVKNIIGLYTINISYLDKR